MRLDFSLYEIDPENIKHLKQAMVWGAGSLIGSRLSKDNEKKLTDEEKSKEDKKSLIQGLVGAAAGAAGSKFS